MRTELAECKECHVLAHRPLDEPYLCPECHGPLARGGFAVGFADARRVYGEPGAPWAPPPEKDEKRKRYACADGHAVRSREEKRIDDWLHARGILHEIEPKLKGMRPDWRVGDVYVEFWGLAGQRGYEARREEKLALYRRRGLKLVEVFPEDLERLDAKLGALASPRAWF
jgi:hypothetical protein